VLEIENLFETFRENSLSVSKGFSRKVYLGNYLDFPLLKISGLFAHTFSRPSPFFN